MSPPPRLPQIDSDTLREIVEGTAAETGESFFDELSRHLARALGTYGAWVTEWLPEERRLRALSFWCGDDFYGDYEYDIRQTPCEPVIENRELVHVPERLLELFPGDPDIREMDAASYLGVPLFDSDGSVLGHLAVLDTKPLPEDPRVTAIFRIFAGRASAELRRLRRDRDLREREQKLSRLIDSAMDAIVELDAELRVAGINRAAEKVFGLEPGRGEEAAQDDAASGAALHGRPFGDLLNKESSGKLHRLTAELDRQPEGRQSLWIPDGLEARRSDGRPTAVEGTISRFALRGRARYTVILRDLDDRLAAEARIRALLDETASLRSEIERLHGFEEIVGESDALRRVLRDVEKVASGDTTVLLTGETGTGKELFARAIHRHSARAEGPLVKVNCAAIAAGLQESEFFGHEKGAFTGATERREGRFKLADGGTIFLDEVGELPLDLQAKLLRVLQEGEYEPVGSSVTVRVNVRVIAATNRDLARMAKEGAFRQDLFYRLDVFPIRVPPLRERGDDVLRLAEVFARRLAGQRGVDPLPLSADARVRLRRYAWPGNIRELQNVIERAWITSSDGRTLNLAGALPDAPGLMAVASPGSTLPPAAGDERRVLTALELQDLERANLVRALEVCAWKVSGKGGAAEMLGLPPNTLASRLKALGIHRPA